MKNILFVASESVPFIKTGGLADVVGSLPKALDSRYFDCRVVLPYYSCMAQKWKDLLQYKTNFYMDFDWNSCYVGIFECVYEGVHFYFIDNQDYFTSDKPYAGMPWDMGRFAFFSKAALSILPTIDFRPDVIHCHDWQTGLVPVYLNAYFQDNEFYRGIKTVMTIHNLKFLYANAITTVSRSYAEEIKMPYYGEGLDGLMRAREHDLRGIVNGIDYTVFNPATDPNLYQNYDARTFRKEKVKNKTALQADLGLNVDPKTMLIGIVSRLTDQKGFDLIAYVMDEMCQDSVQFAVLGTGDEKYENMFRHFAWKYGGKVSAQIYYNESLANKIYAGSDAFLMPSQFEPCGLSQLIALRYGTLPIVRETGGLRDTVQPYNEFEGTGTGFSFSNYNAHEMMGTVRYAEKIYYDKRREWNKMIDRAMEQDFSWEHSALEYQELYDWLIG